MALQTFANSPTPGNPSTPWSSLSALLGSGATALSITAHTSFPQTGSFWILVGVQGVDGTLTNAERMHVTAGAGTASWTVTRSVAVAHAFGESVFHVLTAEGLAASPGPMTAAGDFAYLNASLVPARLGAPANGVYNVTFTGAVPSWTAAVDYLTQAEGDALYQPVGSYAAASHTHTHSQITNFAAGVALYAPATTPASPVNSLQFNNAGAFGGSAGLTWDGTNVIAAGSFRGGNSAIIPFGVVPTQSFHVYASDGVGDANPLFAGLVVTPTADTADSFFGLVSRLYLHGTFDYDGAYLVGQDSQVITNGAVVVSSGTVANQAFNYNAAATSIAKQYGVLALVSSDIGTIDTQYGVWTAVGACDGTVNHSYQFYAAAPQCGIVPTLNVGFWSDALGGLATHAYSFWADEQGVFRIKSDNTFNGVYQAIPALYNPQFTKYVAGATDYERIVQQWVSNVATIGTEAGAGASVLRALNLIGSAVTINGVAAVTTTGAQALSNKTGAISQWTNDASFTTLAAVAGVGYLTSVTAHALLSATHSDTLAGTVIRGDLIYGNSTPAWARLAKPSVLSGLSHDGTDVSWVTANGTGAPARTTSPVFVTPTLGVASATSISIGNGSAASPAIVIASQEPSNTVGFFYSTSIPGIVAMSQDTAAVSLAYVGIGLVRDARLSWSSNQFDVQSAHDLFLYRDGAANTLAQRNSTTAQKRRSYNTFTTVLTVGEWWKEDWITTANQLRFGTAMGTSTGTARVSSWDYGGLEASPVAAITVPIASGGITFGGPPLLPAGTTTLASLRVPHGVAPTSPVNGDIWTDVTALWVRINGVTKQVAFV